VLTAAEWQLFTFMLGPVYLKDLLPEQDYEEFISLIEEIQLCCDYSLTHEQIENVKAWMKRFSKSYVDRYYKME
jgi:hypothetical protein